MSLWQRRANCSILETSSRSSAVVTFAETATHSNRKRAHLDSVEDSVSAGVDASEYRVFLVVDLRQQLLQKIPGVCDSVDLCPDLRLKYDFQSHSNSCRLRNILSLLPVRGDVRPAGEFGGLLLYFFVGVAPGHDHDPSPSSLKLSGIIP